MLKYLFVFLGLSFSSLVFADGFKAHVYNASPYPIRAWAEYVRSSCSSYEMKIDPGTSSWDWTPPFGCGLVDIKEVYYEYTDEGGVVHNYWYSLRSSGGHDMDICIYGDPKKDNHNVTGNWSSCKPQCE